MNEELEALKYLKENKRRHWLDNDKSNECLDIIEKELARTEEYKHNHQVEMRERQSIFKDLLKEKREHEFLSEHYNELLNEYNKEHKALEIIKEKKIDVELFNETPNIDEYNNWCSDKAKLTKEEYDLLKEVLL